MTIGLNKQSPLTNLIYFSCQCFTNLLNIFRQRSRISSIKKSRNNVSNIQYNVNCKYNINKTTTYLSTSCMLQSNPINILYQKFGLMIKLGLIVFNLFDHKVKYSVLFFIYTVLWIRSTDPAHKNYQNIIPVRLRTQ